MKSIKNSVCNKRRKEDGIYKTHIDFNVIHSYFAHISKNMDPQTTAVFHAMYDAFFNTIGTFIYENEDIQLNDNQKAELVGDLYNVFEDGFGRELLKVPTEFEEDDTEE